MSTTAKKVSVVALFACVMALCLALFGCGGNNASSDNSSSGSSSSSSSSEASNPNASEYDEYFTGEWHSTSEIVPGQGEVQTTQYTININEDGTFNVEDDGAEIITGTWKAKDQQFADAEESDGKYCELEVPQPGKLIYDSLEAGGKKIIAVR